MTHGVVSLFAVYTTPFSEYTKNIQRQHGTTRIHNLEVACNKFPVKSRCFEAFSRTRPTVVRISYEWALMALWEVRLCILRGLRTMSKKAGFCDSHL